MKCIGIFCHFPSLGLCKNLISFPTEDRKLFYTANSVAADGLMVQGANASAVIVATF